MANLCNKRDAARTDRNHSFFEGDNNANISMLYEILMTYLMYNFDLGYVQGMSDFLSPIMVVMQDEVESFWSFVRFLQKTHRNFEMDQSAIKLQLHNLKVLLCCVDHELGYYLEAKEADNMFFTFRWLLVLFKREFSFDDIMALWEVLWTDLPCENFHLLICVAILVQQKNMITENEFGFTEILKYVNNLSMNIDVNKTLTVAEGVYHQLFSSQDQLPAEVLTMLGFVNESTKPSSVQAV
ncbi:unnamed protein product [Soboliphyme baturini]|uniref:Rab-GAP TBC domain-containing protein n=1 Tax=Soboliphyme baturini TaxID=241478 RepID=A0A183IDC9_9BILA|nr:unnamed protein product [Soboliphyme baturini]